jgi:ketosteroid isomerase-like protein
MSQENVEVVRAAYEAWHHDGLEAMLDAYWAEAIDHRSVEGAPDDRGPIQGKDAMRAFLQDWVDTFEDFKVEAVEVIDAGGENVVMVQRISGRARLSGVDTQMQIAIHFAIRDGRITVGREYATRSEALEAVGLSE